MSKNFMRAPLVFLALTAGCGQVKDRDDRVVVATATSPTSTEQASKDAIDWNALRQFVELYGGGNGEGLSRAALANIFEKYKDQFAKFLAGTKLAPSELIDLLFKSFDANGDGRLNPGEVAGGLQQRVPILRWIPNNSSDLSEDELGAALLGEYPKASERARGLLKSTLLRYDEPWAGGRGNGRVTRQELASAGLLLGMLGDVDFSAPVALPPGAPQDQQLVVEQLHNKVDEQLFGRYEPLTDYTKLATADAQLEWSSLALEFHLIDRLADVFGSDGAIPLATLSDALAAWGEQPKAHWQNLYTLYDQAFLGGSGKGQVATLELFNLLTDLRFAERLRLHLGRLECMQSARDNCYPASAAAVNTSPERAYLLAALLTLYPRTGQSLFTHDGYWIGLKAFDTKRLGGDGNGALDEAELATALAYARLTENVYAAYDTNHDGLLSKAEALSLFKSLGINDKRLVDAFFADIGLDSPSGDVGFWEKLKLFFSGGLKTPPLIPYDFYTRLMKVLPRLISGNPAGSGRSGD